LSGVSTPLVKIVNEPGFAETGLYSVKITGNPVSATKSAYSYKIADTKIAVSENLQLSFWKYTVDELGKFTSVDLLFKSGKKLSALANYTDNNGVAMSAANARGTIGEWQKFTCQIGKDELVGDIITGISIAYNHPSDGGVFTAYFDDLLIEYGEGNGIPNSIISLDEKDLLKIYGTKGHLHILDLKADSRLQVYTMTGQLIYQQDHLSGSHHVSIPSGFYIARISCKGTVFTKKVIVPAD
jgi:hypothetical protein